MSVARRRHSRLRWAAGATIAGVAVLAVAGLANSARRSNEESPPQATSVNTDGMAGGRAPLVFAYFFYWYDAQTMQHLEPGSGLPTHLPADPAPSWRSVAWFRRQLEDMSAAGIDVALPVYWGVGETWSPEGLPYLARAKREIDAKGAASPDIGLFYDTTILKGKDLTSPEGQTFLYAGIREFFSRIPREQWALVDGRPVIFLYFSFFAAAFDQGTFDDLYARFFTDFGVRPYIVREMTWDFAKDLASGEIDRSRPIATEANFKWGAALDGFLDRASVAAVGPGFDEREIPGRGDAYRSRDGGDWYADNFRKAIASGRRMLVIETWNEIHEASGIGETIEYGRQYIDLTRELVGEFKAAYATGNR